MRHKTLVNYVAIAEKGDWREEGWSIPSTIEELLNEYRDFHESTRGIIEAGAPAERVRGGEAEVLEWLGVRRV